MNEQDNSRKMSRRDFMKRAALVGGGFASLVGVAGAGIELMNSVDRQERQDHYKGIPFNEYAYGDFTLVVGNYSDAKKTIVSADPFVDSVEQLDNSKIEAVNGKLVDGEFILSNPGIVRGFDPLTNEENAPWMVIQAGLRKAGRGFFSSAEDKKLLYVYLGKEQDDGKPVEFRQVQMNTQGIHLDRTTRKPVTYMGDVSFPVTMGFNL